MLSFETLLLIHVAIDMKNAWVHKVWEPQTYCWNSNIKCVQHKMTCILNDTICRCEKCFWIWKTEINRKIEENQKYGKNIEFKFQRKKKYLIASHLHWIHIVFDLYTKYFNKLNSHTDLAQYNFFLSKSRIGFNSDT